MSAHVFRGGSWPEGTADHGSASKAHQGAGDEKGLSSMSALAGASLAIVSTGTTIPGKR